MENLECNKNFIDSNKNFLNTAIESLEDNKLSENEKDTLNSLINEYNIQKEDSENQCKNEISEIKSTIELKRLLKNSQEYSEVISEISSLSKRKIKDIQYILWTRVDWLFWINTFIKYKNSPLSETFSNIWELANWRRVWNNIKRFIENFSKLNWMDSEILAIVLSSWITKNSFVFIDENWSIIVKTKEWWDDIISFSEKPSLESLVHDSLIKNDISLISRQLYLISDRSDKKNYIDTLKSTIKEYNYQTEARKLFSEQNWDSFKLKLPNSSLNKYMTAYDLFWDIAELKVGNEIYTNDWVDKFVSSKTWKKLYIYNSKIIDIYNSDHVERKTAQETLRDKKKEELLPEHKKQAEMNSQTEDNNTVENNAETINENIESPLSKEFWEWITKEWVKLLWRTWKNSCWEAVALLFDTFLRKKWLWKWIKLSSARNWANFDSILDSWNISKENPFIIQWEWRTYKITNESELRKSWVDITKVLNEKIEIKKRKIDFPKDAKSWEIVVYNEDADSRRASSARKRFWHVEVKWDNGMFYSYYKSSKAWWSASEKQSGSPEDYRRLTGFTWYAYSINMKNA